jgi:hypothetical protein
MYDEVKRRRRRRRRQKKFHDAFLCRFLQH